MECNKEEAVRAREIAEQKMQNGDFEGAKKFALKAQRLFPELENISQLLTVCDIHYCAKHKQCGSEKDWYGILEIEQSADENSIKKQYRKLALLLHPDKNKFAGAEAAFKLIGEANMILSDQMKRSQYDMKCRISVKSTPKPTSYSSNRAYDSMNNYKNGSSKFTSSDSYQQAPHLTFFTICSACGNRCQYYKDFVNKLLRCPACRTSFIARDMGPCKVSSQFNGGKPSGIQFSHIFSGPAPIPKVPLGECKKQEKVGVQMCQPYEGLTARGRKNGVEMPNPKAARAKESGTSRNAKKSGRKSVEESDDSCETDSRVEDAGRGCFGNSSGLNSSHSLRRSSRQKQHISYEEKLIDDDIFYPANEEILDDSVDSTAAADLCRKEVKQKASACPEDTVPKKKSKTGDTESSMDVNPSPQVLEYPDPEFSDFEKHRAENCFAANQVWAIYDSIDGMPRYYARVNKVFKTGFKVRITWLEPEAVEKNEQNWDGKNLPVSCGKYCNGTSEVSVDHAMFSHQIDSIKVFDKSSFLVYPQKGETWALFRDWDVKWASEPEMHRPPYQYDFVEVVTDFDEENGIGVAHLGKVKGFVCIFQQIERDGVISFQVSPQERYRFSHQIASFRMTGNEREGVPVGSFELDPAALPTNLE